MNAFMVKYAWVGGLAFLVVALTTGCSGYTTLSTAVAVNGALVADEGLRAAEWGVCEATTVGAWRRRYGGSDDKIDGWRKLCSKDAPAPVPSHAFP